MSDKSRYDQYMDEWIAGVKRESKLAALAQALGALFLCALFIAGLVLLAGATGQVLARFVAR